MQKHLSVGSKLQIVWQMGWSDFLLKYRGSVLGYFWSFADPLLRFTVIFFVFHPFIGGAVRAYPLYLFLGIIVWDTFVRTVTGSITMLIDKAAIIQKIPFQKELLIYAVGWTNTIIFCTHLVIFFCIALISGEYPTKSILLLPLLVILLQLFSMGLGMFLSAFSLKFKDIPHLWQVLHQILFWLTPVFYPYQMTETFLQKASSYFSDISSLFGWQIFSAFIRFQPLSILLYDIRRVVLYAEEGIPSFVHLLILTILIGIFFSLGLFVFRKRSRYFIQEY